MMTKENDKVDHDSQDLGAAGADKVCTSSHSTSWGEAASPAPSKRHLGKRKQIVTQRPNNGDGYAPLSVRKEGDELAIEGEGQ